MNARRYTGIGIAAWRCVVQAGDGPSLWPRISRGERVIGSAAAPDALTLAHAACEPVWRVIASDAHLPAWGFSTSKGDPWSFDRWRNDPTAIRLAPPGALSMHLARQLGIGVHLPCPVAAACSTGLYALLAVADGIGDGVTDRGLAGAVDGGLPPWLHAGFDQLGVISHDGIPRSRVDDPTADSHGFLPAAGAAAIALRWDRSGRDPWRLTAGVRLGDAGHETHFRDPATLRTALQVLWDVAPHPDAIVCHATGTATGDAYERAELDRGPWRDIPRWCWKPLIGHTLGASGVVELALALEAPVQRLWKLSLGFGGHLAAVAVERRAV